MYSLHALKRSHSSSQFFPHTRKVSHLISKSEETLCKATIRYTKNMLAYNEKLCHFCLAMFFFACESWTCVDVYVVYVRTRKLDCKNSGEDL